MKRNGADGFADVREGSAKAGLVYPPMKGGHKNFLRGVLAGVASVHRRTYILPAGMNGRAEASEVLTPVVFCGSAAR